MRVPGSHGLRRARLAPAATLLIGALLIGCDKPVSNIPYQSRQPIPVDLVGRLAYASDSNGLGTAKSGIHEMNFDLDVGFTIAAFDNVDVKDLSWTPEGTRVTYAARAGNSQAHWRLYSVSEDGVNTTEHFPTAAEVDLTHPAWSSSGRLAYVQSDDFDKSVFIDGEIFFGAAEVVSKPVWSRDESFLFAGTETLTASDVLRSAIDRISVAGASFTGLIQDTDPLANLDEFTHPALSPNGTMLAFVKNPAGTQKSEIWTMGIDGTNPVSLTSGQMDSYPAWGPDGKYIAFHRLRDVFDPQGDPGGIFVIHPDGTGLAQLSYDNGRYPTWTR